VKVELFYIKMLAFLVRILDAVNAPISILHLVENIHTLDRGALGRRIHVLIDLKIDSVFSVVCCSGFTCCPREIACACFVYSEKYRFVKVLVGV